VRGKGELNCWLLCDVYSLEFFIVLLCIAAFTLQKSSSDRQDSWFLGVKDWWVGGGGGGKTTLNVTVTKCSCTQRRSHKNVRVTKRKHHITLTTVTSLRFLTFTFWNYFVLKLLHLETITFRDATLSDINVVLCYILSQYQISSTRLIWPMIGEEPQNIFHEV
jgi:hypothetical protein